MRKLLLFLLAVSFFTIAALSQTAAPGPGTDSIRNNQKFYFPPSYYKDATALSAAMRQMAQAVMKASHSANKIKYFTAAIWYQFLSGNYGGALAMLDSAQQILDDKTYGIELKCYALALISESKEIGSFKAAFKKEFSLAFANLSFPKRAYLAIKDSSRLNELRKDYVSEQDRLQKNNEDSLGLEDMQSIAEAFAKYSIYNTICPLMSPFMTSEYRAKFPAIHSVSWAGVVPVNDLDEMPDPNMQYNLLFELTGFAYNEQDSTAKKEINSGLGSVAHELNLHEANGIPRKNIHVVVVVHGSAINAFLNNEKYKKRYGVDNPNIEVIKELQDYGVRIIVCGQLVTRVRLEMKDLVAGLHEALTAQTVISSYQLKGYVYFDMSLRE